MGYRLYLDYGPHKRRYDEIVGEVDPAEVERLCRAYVEYAKNVRWWWSSEKRREWENALLDELRTERDAIHLRQDGVFTEEDLPGQVRLRVIDAFWNWYWGDVK